MINPKARKTFTRQISNKPQTTDNQKQCYLAQIRSFQHCKSVLNWQIYMGVVKCDKPTRLTDCQKEKIKTGDPLITDTAGSLSRALQYTIQYTDGKTVVSSGRRIVLLCVTRSNITILRQRGHTGGHSSYLQRVDVTTSHTDHGHRFGGKLPLVYKVGHSQSVVRT